MVALTAPDNQRLLVFYLDEQSWALDLDQLTLNDQIHLEQHAGRSWGRLLAAFYDDRDTLALKTLWWAARRAAGEPIEFTDRSMNPRASDLRFAVGSNQPGPVTFRPAPATGDQGQAPAAEHTVNDADRTWKPATADQASTIATEAAAAAH